MATAAATTAATATGPGSAQGLTGIALGLEMIRRYRGSIVPVAIVSLFVVLLVPLPPMILDVLIALNFALSLVVLLTVISMDHPLDFSAFPSLLLAVTLFRLVLNVASTRLILTAEASSPEEAASAAGAVIMAFGQFVAGNSLFVGIVLFLILTIIQFVVITKGATRISEVAARFTLDAMPGKQMAIDSDLNAGIITEAEARERREKISREADFFGAMDGASKFVRGDAVAGLLITLINVAGGFAVGMIARGWEAGATAEVFTKLTIGDGLASAIPSFIIAIASALIVTRSGTKEQLGDALTAQLSSQPKGLYMAAAFLAALALTPLPTVPLMTGAAVLVAVGFFVRRNQKEAKAKVQAKTEAAATEPPAVENLLKVDTLELEVGYALVALVDAGQGGDLLDRITATRRQLAVELGLVMPPVRIRDNLQLPGTEYRVKIRNSIVAAGVTRPGKLLAMDSGLATGSIDGEATTEPAFGLPALWIDPGLRTRAETMNYTVVEPSAVLTTHLTEIVRKHADELLTRDEVGNLLEQLKGKAPKLVEEVVPTIVKPIELQKILQNLLRERVPIRDLETILETLAEWGPKSKDLEVLTEYVRNALKRTICGQYTQPGEDGRQTLLCATLDPSLEDLVGAYIDRGAAGTTVSVPARLAQRIADQIARGLQQVSASGRHPVVIASPQVRGVIKQLLEPHVPGVAVLGYNEVVSGVDVQSVALIMPPPETNAKIAA